MTLPKICAALAGDKGSFNIGVRLVRNAVSGTGSVTSAGTEHTERTGGKVLIAFFSWGGNTKGIAEEIQAQTDQNEQARPELAVHVENMEEYDMVILGYPKMEYGFNCVLCA